MLRRVLLRSGRIATRRYPCAIGLRRRLILRVCVLIQVQRLIRWIDMPVMWCIRDTAPALCCRCLGCSGHGPGGWFRWCPGLRVGAAQWRWRPLGRVDRRLEAVPSIGHLRLVAGQVAVRLHGIVVLRRRGHRPERSVISTAPH